MKQPYVIERADSEIGLNLCFFPDPLDLNITLVSTSISLALVTHSWLHLVAVFFTSLSYMLRF